MKNILVVLFLSILAAEAKSEIPKRWASGYAIPVELNNVPYLAYTGQERCSEKEEDLIELINERADRACKYNNRDMSLTWELKSYLDVEPIPSLGVKFYKKGTIFNSCRHYYTFALLDTPPTCGDFNKVKNHIVFKEITCK